MEELRTTEVLEHEILEDARKKAARLLKTTDDSLSQQKGDWERKLSGDLETLRHTYMNRMKRTKEDIFARLPIDKRRLSLKTHEEFLSAAIDDFLLGLDRKRLLFLLERELLERLNAVAEYAVDENIGDESAGDEDGKHAAVVRYSGLDVAEARAILKKSPVSFDWQFQEGLLANDLSFQSTHGHFPFVVIETGAFRLTASVELAATALLKDKREELAVALLGPEALL